MKVTLIDGDFPYDGILGLSQSNESYNGNGTSYMKALYDQKVIGSNEITFWLNVDGVASSTVTFGGVPDGSSIGKTFS